MSRGCVRLFGSPEHRANPEPPGPRPDPQVRAPSRDTRMTTDTLESVIDAAFERRMELTPAQVPAELSTALSEVIDGLSRGRLRVAERIDGTWVTHQWLKKAVLLYFRAHDNRAI